MSTTVPTVGDYGTLIYVRILDEDGTPQDPTAATALTAVVIKPDRTKLEAEITLAPSTDPDHLPADGWTQFEVPDADWLDQAGLWRLRPRYTIDGMGSWRSSLPASLYVAP
jgi:hypothetical protein